MDWLRFEPADDVLNIEIRVSEMLESLPGDIDKYCQEVMYPVLDQIQELCLRKNLKQSCKVNLANVAFQNLNVLMLIKFIWNIHNHTKDHFLINKCEMSGGDSIFDALVETVKSLLPGVLRDKIILGSKTK
jgi:hypothetical protein